MVFAKAKKRWYDSVEWYSVPIILVLSIAEYWGWFAPIRSLGEQITRPIIAGITSQIKKVQEPLYIVTTRGVRLSEYQQLQRQYAQALERVAELESVEAENVLLREASSFAIADQLQQRVTAPILTADGTYIGIGAADGVENGALVLVRGNLVGKVVNTMAHQSQVVPLQQLGADEPIIAKTENGVIGLLYGNGKQLLLAELSRDSVVERGARVVTAGQEGIPPGISIGTVRSIEERVSAPTLTAVIEQPSTIFEATVVQVW